MKKLPCFAELPDATKTVDGVKAMHESPPIIYMHLEDLEKEESEIRGAYDTSRPDIDPEIALKHGRRFTQWLTRYPDWRRSHHPNSTIFLIEVTPITEEHKGQTTWLNVRWQIVVVEEAAHKERRFQERAQLAHAWRGA